MHNQMNASGEPDAGVGPYRGGICPAMDVEPMRLALAEVASWVCEADIVLGRGRNLVVRSSRVIEGQSYEFVIKSFGRQSLAKDAVDRRLGTKAKRAFDVATHLTEAGVGTPFPIAYLERWDGRRLVEAYLVTEFEADTTEFRNCLIDLYAVHGPSSALLMALQRVADAVRAMHDAGVVHRDLGNQNILLKDLPEPDVLFADLNRARIVPALSEAARGSDISRIHLPSDLLRVFREMYWKGVPPARFVRAERSARRRFYVHTVTRRYRHPIRSSKEVSPEVDYPMDRDIWIWDTNSSQAIPAFAGKERRSMMSRRSVLWQVASVARHGPMVLNRYREWMRNVYRQPVTMQNRVGVCLEPSAPGLDQRLSLLCELGDVPVHIRFYHHQGEEQWAASVKVAKTLQANGHRVSIALVQDRRAVLHEEGWRNFCHAIVQELADGVDFVEIGHAVNRVKWGLWGLDDWVKLVSVLPALQARFPHVDFTGPSGIDFEYPWILAALDKMPEGAGFSALSHHLYVDRRGSPESRQGRFSTVEKCALARSIAGQHRACGDRFICSEVNWPLAGTGIYSPVGSPYLYPGQKVGHPSVTEEDYAAYMIRYFLITLCSGLVDRVYWWRLAAHGYGLVDDLEQDASSWRCRPAFHALRCLLNYCGRATFVGRVQQDDGALWFQFEREEDDPVWVGYREDGTGWANLPCRGKAIIDGFGHEREGAMERVELSGTPVYVVEAEHGG